MAIAVLRSESRSESRSWKRIRESRKVRGGVIVADPRYSDVFGHHGFAFFLELLAETSSSAAKPMPIMWRPAPMASVFCATLFLVMSTNSETEADRAVHRQRRSPA